MSVQTALLVKNRTRGDSGKLAGGACGCFSFFAARMPAAAVGRLPQGRDAWGVAADEDEAIGEGGDQIEGRCAQADAIRRS